MAGPTRELEEQRLEIDRLLAQLLQREAGAHDGCGHSVGRRRGVEFDDVDAGAGLRMCRRGRGAIRAERGRPERRHAARDRGETPGDPLGIAGHAQAEARAPSPIAQSVDGEQMSVHQDGDPVGELLDLGQHVRRDDDRMGAGQRADDVAHLDDLRRVEPVGGLVQDQHRGLVEERLRDRHALAKALGERAHREVADGLESQSLANPVHGRARRCAGEALDGPHEAEELAHPHALVERGVFSDVADLLTSAHGMGDWVEAGNLHPTRRGGQIAGQDAEDRRLAGAVGAEESHDLAPIDGQGDVLDGQARSVPLGEAIGDDGGGHDQRRARRGPGRGSVELRPRAA